MGLIEKSQTERFIFFYFFNNFLYNSIEKNAPFTHYGRRLENEAKFKERKCCDYLLRLDSKSEKTFRYYARLVYKHYFVVR